jgi:hypothetical protein
MKKIKWFGIGTTSALSVGVVATAAVIQATSAGVVSFNPGTMSAIEDVVANQDQAEVFSMGEISVPGITNGSKKTGGKGDNGDKGSSPQDDSVISAEDDLTGSTDDVVSPVSGTSPSTVVSSTTPVEEESVVSVVTPISEVTPSTPVSSSTPSTPVSGGSPSTPVSND